MRVRTRDLAAREDKLEALQQKLTESVGALVTGEDWKRALEFAAKFRSRSFNNTMLIYVQHGTVALSVWTMTAQEDLRSGLFKTHPGRMDDVQQSTRPPTTVA